ncbi:MAG: DMT family transporter [Negativicutes bacterium]|nr:DMT family transporter [Negativicutes bacterium]
MSPYYTGVALVLFSTVGFGLMPIFALFTYQYGANVVTLLQLRFAFAALLLFCYLWRRGIKIAVSRRELGLLFILGSVLYACQSSLYFSAVLYIPASLAALLLYTYPVFVALLAVVFDKEKLSVVTLAAIVLSTAGLALVLGASPAAVNPLGVLMALGSAVVYSIYIVLGNRVVKNLSPMVTSAFAAMFAALSLSLSGLASGSLNYHLPPPAWLALAGIVAFSTIMAMLTLFRGLELIGPTKASILSTVEPLITFGFSALFFADRLTLAQIAGGLTVLVGAVLAVKVRRKTGDDKTDFMPPAKKEEAG